MPVLTAQKAARLFSASAREDTEESVPFPLTGRPSGLKPNTRPVRAAKRIAGTREAVSTKRALSGKKNTRKR